MTLKNTETTWDELPATITTYLVAHPKRDIAAAITAFTADAVVTDEGHDYRGRDAIAAWLSSAGSEYTFTTDFISATTTGAHHADVVLRLIGDFPGGVVDLHYRFILDGALINRLEIEP